MRSRLPERTTGADSEYAAATCSSSISALRTYSSKGGSSGVLMGPTARQVMSFLLSPVVVNFPTLIGAAPACLSAVTLLTETPYRGTAC